MANKLACTTNWFSMYARSRQSTNCSMGIRAKRTLNKTKSDGGRNQVNLCVTINDAIRRKHMDTNGD